MKQLIEVEYTTATQRNHRETVAVNDQKDVQLELEVKTRHNFDRRDSRSNILSLTERTPDQVTLGDLSIVEFMEMQDRDVTDTNLRAFRVVYNTKTHLAQEEIILMPYQQPIEPLLTAKSKKNFNASEPESQIIRTDELYLEQVKLHEVSITEFATMVTATTPID